MKEFVNIALEKLHQMIQKFLENLVKQLEMKIFKN